MSLPTFVRTSNGFEQRASPSAAAIDLAEDRFIRGTAVVFNVLSEDLGGFRERILPEAVNRSLKADIRALVDHETSKVLGRTRAGTLALRKEKHGLTFKIEPDPEISYARDLMRAVSRGDVTGASFRFITLEDDWHKEDGKVVRDVIDMEIPEISIVTFPAYLEADVQVAQRSLKAFQERAQPFDWQRMLHEINTIRYGG
jgi:uncharacterized protein